MFAELIAGALLPVRDTALDVSVGGVSCPSRTVVASIANTGADDESYELLVAGKVQRREVVLSDSSVTSAVPLKEDRRTTITIRSGKTVLASVTRTANCAKSRKHPAGHGHARSGGKTLPMTGTGTSLAVTSGATILTGALLTWYGLLWPGRRQRLFP
jgi:acetyl/propionyl-CoA carboxylase alpha subunit